MLSDPDVVAALQCWWDETRSFAVGVTSSVIADLLQERGFGAHYSERAVLDVLRGRAVRSVDDPLLFDRFGSAAGVFSLGGVTASNPKFRRVVEYLWDRLTVAGESVPDAYIILGWETARRVAESWEMRDYIAYGSMSPIDYRTGLPKYYMGFKLLVSDAQPEWQIDGVCRDTIITARIVA